MGDLKGPGLCIAPHLLSGLPAAACGKDSAPGRAASLLSSALFLFPSAAGEGPGPSLPALLPSLLTLLLASLAASVYVFYAAPGWRLRHLPGPRYAWLVGNLPEIARKGLHVAHLDWMRAYGAIYKHYAGPALLVVVTRPELAREVCVRNFRRLHDRFELSPNELSPWTMIFGRGAYWEGLRSAVVPLFHSDKLASYAAPINGCVDLLLDRLAARGGGAPVNAAHEFHVATLDMIGSVIFGASFSSYDGGRLVHAAQTTLDQFNVTGKDAPYSAPFQFLAPQLHPFMKRLFELIPGTPEHRGRASRDYSNAAVVALSKPPGGGGGGGGGGAGRIDFLSWLASNARAEKVNGPLSLRSVQAVSMDFMLAGSETAGTTLAFCVYYLCRNPECERLLLEEIDANLASGERPTFEDMAKFPYAAAVMRETLRAVPPTNGVSRVANDDVTIGGYAIPKGTQVYVDIFGIHHSPELYPEPDAFKPERFLPGGHAVAKDFHANAYMPFGDGPRKCPGYRLAEENVMLALVRVYQRFTFRLARAEMMTEAMPQMSFGIALKAEHGIPVHVLPRTSAGRM